MSVASYNRPSTQTVGQPSSSLEGHLSAEDPGPSSRTANEIQPHMQEEVGQAKLHDSNEVQPQDTNAVRPHGELCQSGNEVLASIIQLPETSSNGGIGEHFTGNPSSQDRISVSRSRSVTPTPAISIEPDLGLEWTADMLSLPESEVVTSDTALAKARGSNTTTSSSVVFPSDDDSLDGDQVFGDDTPEEGGEGDSEGGGADSEGTSLETPAQSALSDSDNVSLHAMVSHVLLGTRWPERRCNPLA